MTKRLLLVLVLSLAWCGTAFAQGGQQVNTELPNASTPSDTDANPTAPAVKAYGMAWSGSVWSRVIFGTAGTPATQVWTVQGVAGMTPLVTNITQVSGAAQSATNPLYVRLSDGSASVSPDTQGTHNVALTPATTTGGFQMCRTAAVLPTAAGGDDRASLYTCTRQGQQYVVDASTGATGAAPPASASYLGGQTSGATGGLVGAVTVCDSQGWLDMTTATTTEIAPLVAGRTIYVCSVLAEAGGTTTMTLKRGTGANCGTGTTSVSPGFELTAQTGFALGNGVGVVLGSAGAGTVGGATTAANALCVTNSAAVNLHVIVRYAVY